MSIPEPVKQYAGGRVGFLGSFVDPGALPVMPLPEICFAGRSNVGKSSAINRLLNVKKAARVSGTPGRTQAINLFVVERRVCFADLPGYGFAKVPQGVQAAWKPLIEGYLGTREALKLAVVLIDARHPVQRMDADLVWSLREVRLPILLLATKLDKVKRSKRQSTLAKLRKDYALSKKELIGFSSTDGTGIDGAWAIFEKAIAGELQG